MSHSNNNVVMPVKRQTKALASTRKIVVSGQVQGVGFRPFIHKLANTHKLTGWVKNCLGVVEIQVQGKALNIQNFSHDIFNKKPSLAKPELESSENILAPPLESFCIAQSQSNKQNNAHISVPTDLFLCDQCLAELNDPDNRRYRYPFINCTQCGPRYTIIQQLPYDRPNTTMAAFELCAPCRAEYNDVNNRRFHAEPVACPLCGPFLTFHSGETYIDGNESSLQHTITALQNGETVAVKGIGGYHLMCDATNPKAVSQLRLNKNRPHKPLAVLFPSPVKAPFKYLEKQAVLTTQDKTFLSQASRPVLLVKKSKQATLAANISPDLNEIGAMLPYSPLHHLLLDMFDAPLVATSANISGEPVLIHNNEVEKRLLNIADAFLHHNRKVERPADDPVYKTIASQPRIIRCGRGSAPLEITLPFELDRPVLAVGAHMKNAITLAWGSRSITSPHIGEMNSVRSLEVFKKTIDDFQQLYKVKPETIICDAHPGYTTTRWAHKQNIPVHHIYHHHAHASSAYFECKTTENIILFAWDGIGYGEDKTLWGGETFFGRPGHWQRVATMRPFYLPGGDQAARQPWRSAAALCWETAQEYDDISEQFKLLHAAWKKKINSPQTSSVGRLFDAAAALSNVCKDASFEGQGPMLLEALADNYISDNNINYSSTVRSENIDLNINTHHKLFITDWQPLVSKMLDSNISKEQRAFSFHSSMANNILQQALLIRDKHKTNIVSFSGGVFQNRVLTESAIALLSNNGFKVSAPELIPVNDAGISFGQIIEHGYR